MQHKCSNCKKILSDQWVHDKCSLCYKLSGEWSEEDYWAYICHSSAQLDRYKPIAIFTPPVWY